MRIVYMNPNSTQSMTDAVVATAQAALPDADVVGMTNHTGPSAIQGAEDGKAAIPGVKLMAEKARLDGADALVIACFDDTGLFDLQRTSALPVLGIGQAGYVMAQLMGKRFSVVTSLAISVPVLQGNIARLGYADTCASVRASGLPVLEIDRGGAAVIDRLSEEIDAAERDGAEAVVLGCAGMSPLAAALAERTKVPLIDGVVAAGQLAHSVSAFWKSAGL